MATKTYDTVEDRRKDTLKSIFQIRTGIDSFETNFFPEENLVHVTTSKGLTETNRRKLDIAGFSLQVVVPETDEEIRIALRY